MTRKILLIFAVLLIFLPSGAQERKLEKGDKEYSKYAYIDAIATYERLANQGYEEASMFKKLANSYYFNGKLREAAQWYAALFALTDEVEPSVYFRFSQALKAIEDYEKADQYMHLFHQKNQEDLRGLHFIEQTDYLDIIRNIDTIYQLRKAPFNSPYSDFGGTLWMDKIVFSSSRIKPGFSQRISSWNGEAFTKLYSVSVDSAEQHRKPKLFGKGIRKKYNEASPAFSKEGHTMYFTINNLIEKKGKEESVNLQIYRATWNGKKWHEITLLPFNSDAFNTSHPALSPDDKWLYFASDRPGTLGSSDLFRVEILPDGLFGEVENLGNRINTEGRETFPYIAEDHTLYFASEGHPGLGGLDVYKATPDTSGSYREVKNLGTSVNSSLDDFAFYYDNNTRKGFVTSNREGNDNIYTVEKTGEEKPECQQQLLILVEDKHTGAIVHGAVVELFDDKFNTIVTSVTNENGAVLFTNQMVHCGGTYHIRVSKKQYNTNEANLRLPFETGNTQVTIKIDLSVIPVAVGDNLAKVFDIENIIYFDLDKSDIRKDAEIELAKVIDVLRQNPAMKIEVRSHTDSRASHVYNDRLSDKRAKATVKWIIDQGIDASRITGKGFGETQLVNECADGVHCTEAQHQQNRRSEFIITEL